MENQQYGNQRSPVDRRTVLQGIAVSGLAVGAVSGRAGGRDRPDGVSATTTSFRAPAVGLPNEIVIRNTGTSSDTVEYRLAVDGRLELGDEAGENETIEDGNAVTGLIDGVGLDNYHFSGRITAFEITNGADVAEVILNGETVDDPVGLPEEAPEPRECVEIEPLRFENQTVTEFYGYTPDLDAPNPRQSNTPTNLERPGVSRLFLFEGPEGLSLVIIHGGGEGEAGGAASFEITGLPADGEWVVLDDSHEGADDIFEIGETRSVMHWAWGVQGRNDGAAFRGLGEEFRVRIEPAFNEDARRDPIGSGEVEAWQVLSGSARNPDVISVAMDEPIVISTADPGTECPPAGDS